MRKAYKIKVFGRVTGVGFRYSVKNFLNRFSDIQGYVKNCSDNSVEILVQGDFEHINELVRWLRDGGPTLAHIIDMHMAEVDVVENLEYFKIR